MDHSGMDHSGMDHSGMDHSGMDHSGHDMGLTVINTTAKAVVDAVVSGINMAPSSVHVGHSSHMVHMMMNDTDDMGGMGMQMTFHFGYVETILFDWWHISNVGGLIGSMIGIFILALLYEGLKYWREHLFRRAIAAVQYCGNIHKGNITGENKATQYMEQIIMPPTVNMLSVDHGIQTLLHVLQMIISYLLMLIFMTYNVWLCLAVIFGAGVGYFLFGWRKSVVVDITEHCH